MNEPFDIIGIVIVFYFPTEEQIERLKRLDNFKYVYVIDNTPEGKCDFTQFNINYIPFGANRGVATALNMGITSSINDGCEFICMFDQDSEYSEELIKSLYSSYLKLEEKFKHIAVLAPRLILENTEWERSTLNLPYYSVPDVMTSGSLVRASVFNKVGLMEDALFIDLVDTEWCMRAKKFNLLSVIANEIIMYHPLGIKSIKKCGAGFIISNPKRYFYQYRNFLKLFRRNYIPRSFKLRLLYTRILGLIFLPLNTPKPFRSIWYILMGILSGFGLSQYNPNKLK